MSRFRLAVSASIVLAVVTMSTAAYATFVGGGPSPDPFAVGGGRFTGLLGTRDFSLDSHVEKKGLKTYGIWRYGYNGNANASTLLIDVGCVNVQGNRATVGGTLRGSNPVQGWVIYLIDNGPPGGLMDQASYAQVELLPFSGWPEGFPASGTCPSPPDPGADVYNDLFAGDVIVSAGSS